MAVTTLGNIRNEDITFRHARLQSEIVKELPQESIDNTKEVEVPNSLTPEQVKKFLLKKIQLSNDNSECKLYAQTVHWIDDLQEVKKELKNTKAKLERLEHLEDDTPDDIEE